MINVEQSILAPPDGDCFRACVASILEMDLDQVPNFVGMHPQEWFHALEEWLRHFGLGALYVRADEEFKTFAPPGFSVLSVDLKDSDVGHCVVAKDGKIAWDPSPNRATNKVVNLRSWIVLTLLDASEAIKWSTTRAMAMNSLGLSPFQEHSENPPTEVTIDQPPHLNPHPGCDCENCAAARSAGN